MPAANNLPKYAQTPQTFDAVVTAAIGSLNTDTPTGTVLAFTAGANGAILTKLSAMPRANQAAAVSLVVFLAKAATPAVQRPKTSELMAAHTISATAKIPSTEFVAFSEANPWRLGAGDKVYVGAQSAAASGLIFTGEATDF